VIEFLPGALSAENSRALMERIEEHFEEHGFGLWALELPGEAPLVGWTGLSCVDPQMPFAPAVEIGWRLARQYWGRGLATEAASAAADYAFETLRLGSLVSFTARGNVRSRRVMERLGMHRAQGGDFLHPALPAGHDLAEHVLYRLDAAYWRIR
jgi:RimJ/RimL family protein N-acetyltransferase